MPRQSQSSLKVTPEAHATLRRATLQLAGQIGQRITMSEVIIAALAVANRYPDELRAALVAPEQEGTPDE